MAKVFLFISIAVTALTAVLGYMTKTKVDALQGDLKTNKQARAAAEDDARTTHATLKKTEGELATTKKDLDDSKAQVTKLEGDVTAAKADVEKAKADVAARQTEIDALKDKIAKMPVPDPNAPPGIKDTAKDEEIVKLKTEIAEKEKLREAAERREKEAGDRVAGLEREIKRYQEPIMRAGTSGRVISVNSGWNFLITDLGDNKGATPNSPLVVMRGSQMVGRARITQVEPGTSVADIIPGSVPRGTSVQPGDKVVFAGRANTPEKQGGDQGAAKPAAEGAGAKGKAGTAPAPALPQ